MSDVDNIGPLTTDEEYARVQALAARIGGRTSLDKVLRPCNVVGLAEALDIINHGKDVPASENMLGTLVPQGHIAFMSLNGVTTAVGPGRYMLPNPRAEWIGEPRSLTQNTVLREGPITILRIPSGHYALARENNDPVMIAASSDGMFVSASGFFHFDRYVPVAEGHIQHGVLHVIRVQKGQYACVSENQLPAVLPMGVYTFNSTSFQLSRFIDMASQESFRHQTITRFYVRAGSIGLGWQDNAPVLFDKPGVYLVDSAMFVFERSVDIGQREITLGSRKIITVHDGEVGISHDNGVLVVLPPGRHFIDKPGHLFDEFLSTQQQCLPLEKDDSHDSFMVCETSELVRIGVQATVFYNIQNPKLAVVKIGQRRSIERFINETATAVITTIIRSTSLAEIAQGGKTMPKVSKSAGRVKKEGDEEEDEAEEEDFAPNLPFFDRVQGDFLSRLQEHFLREYGIHMLNVRIGDFKVLDSEISKSISNHALFTAETQANLANLEGRRQIDLVNKDSDARIERIQAEVDAYKITTKSKAEAEQIRELTAAKAESTTLEAQAKARAIQIIAEAEAEATKLKGAAEAERAAKLGEIPFGREETLARLQAEMVRGSLAGVQKVVYLPTEMQKNPFAFFDRDSLTSVGGPAMAASQLAKR